MCESDFARLPRVLDRNALDLVSCLRKGLRVGRGAFKERNTERARTLRNQASPAERLLWQRLSNRQVEGCKFSRQMPVGPYFADFLCRERRLVVELDGFGHDMQIEYDARRDRWMADAGYRVLRFTNDDVFERVEGVVWTIAEALRESAEAHPQPLPQAGGGRERAR